MPDIAVSASFAACDMTIANVRYICNPDIPAAEGTEKVSRQVTGALLLSPGARRTLTDERTRGCTRRVTTPTGRRAPTWPGATRCSGLGGNHRIGNELNRGTANLWCGVYQRGR